MADEDALLGAPVVGQEQPIDAVAESPGQLVELGELELDDHVQEPLGTLGLGGQVHHRLGKAAEHVQPLDQVEMARDRHVAVARLVHERLQPGVIVGIGRVGRAVVADRRGIGQRMADDLAHVLPLGVPPEATPVVVAGLVEEPAGLGAIHFADLPQVVRRPGKHLLAKRQPGRAVELDRAADDFTGLHGAHSSGSFTTAPPDSSERSIAMHNSCV